jgi:methylthioribose-1-phosphate isomerase
MVHSVTGSTAAAIFGAGLSIGLPNMANHMTPEEASMAQSLLRAIAVFASCRGLAIDLFLKIVAIAAPKTESYRQLVGVADAILSECDRIENDELERWRASFVSKLKF